MIVKKLFVPANEVNPVGLQEIDMPRLGRFVAIAGKNGAGKSRLLNILVERVQMRINGIEHVHQRRVSIRDIESLIHNNPNHASIPRWQQQIQSEQLQLEITLGRVIADEHLRFKTLRFVPKNLNLTDPRGDNQQTLISRFTTAKSTPVEGYSNHCLPYYNSCKTAGGVLRIPVIRAQQKKKMPRLMSTANLTSLFIRCLVFFLQGQLTTRL